MSNRPASAPEAFDPIGTARRILRTARSGSLATLAAESGAPFASRVIVATAMDGTPLMLLSKLAVHTRNLAADNRASLLLCAEDIRDPMQDARVSVNGRAVVDESAASRRRFLARHKEAEGYAGFTDFAFYRLEVTDAHLVAGFGRIHAISRDDLLLDLSAAAALAEAEEGIVAHMNADHADALALYATKLLGASQSAWRMTGCDPEGLDLVSKTESRRLSFDAPAADPKTMRERLVALAASAREG